MSEDPKSPERPKLCLDSHLRYLDDLRDSGVTNMFGAGPYLQRHSPYLSLAQANEILQYWMVTYSSRHPTEA